MKKSYYLIDLNTVISLIEAKQTIYYRRAGYPPEKVGKKKVLKSTWRGLFCVDIFGSNVYIFEV